MKPDTIDLIHRGKRVAVSLTSVGTGSLQVVYIHGLGCSQLDYQDAIHMAELSRYRQILFDLPGFGYSPHPSVQRVDIDFYVEIVREIIRQLELLNPVLVGHSMGGLIGLLLSEKFSEMIRGFVNVEGNLFPEDCFLSARFIGHDTTRFIEEEFPEMIDRMISSNDPGTVRFAGNLRRFAPVQALLAVSESLVDYSESGNLFHRYRALQLPRLFLYGQSGHRVDLPRFSAAGLAHECIENSGHFPMFENPAAFYSRIARFIDQLPI